MNIQSKKTYYQFFSLFFCCLFTYIVMWAFSGQWPWFENPYNSYVLQAKSWLLGRADLGQNYSHLEIAEYGGKFFVSFPPLPSLVLLPFTMLGISDNYIAITTSLLAVFFAFKICKNHFTNAPVFWALFLTIASNVLLVSFNAWVWFIAQNMSFCATLGAIYFATRKKGVISLLLWSLAIGCRPFQIFYLPLLLVILTGFRLKDFSVKKCVTWFILPAIVGILYMTYNYIRFDNIFEFGHNYLPEFLESPDGQFNLSYIKDNLYSLIRMPRLLPDRRLDFYYFNGINVFLVFPITIFSTVFSLKNIKNSHVITALLCLVLHILALSAHKTMGGWHSGHRYFIDVLPYLFYTLVISMPQSKKTIYLAMPFFVLGLALNLLGIAKMFN